MLEQECRETAPRERTTAGTNFKNGGALTSKERNALPTNDFVFKKDRKYPINDENHARNALARVSQYGTSEEKAKVRSAVSRKYPGIGEK